MLLSDRRGHALGVRPRHPVEAGRDVAGRPSSDAATSPRRRPGASRPHQRSRREPAPRAISDKLLALVLVLATAAACGSTEAATQRRTAVGTYREAVLAHRAGEVERSLELAAQAADTAPGFMDPLLFMGQVEERRGAFEAARGHYLRALELDPTFTAVGVRIGLTYVQEERFGEAREWLLKAVQADPGSFQATFNLGTLARQSGNSEEAVGWYRLAAALEPRDLDALVHIARILLDRGDAAGALEAAESALARDPGPDPEGNALPVVDAARSTASEARRRLGAD